MVTKGAGRLLGLRWSVLRSSAGAGGPLACSSRAPRTRGSFLLSLSEVPDPFADMSSEFLEELHWDDGFAIPVANEENKMLEDQVRVR